MMDIFRRRRRNPYIIPAIVLAVAGAGAAIWYFTSSHKPDESAAAAIANTSAEIATAPATPTAAATPAAVATPATPAAATPPVAAPETPSVPTVAADAAPTTAPATQSAPMPATAPTAVALAPTTTTATTTAPATLPTFNPGTVMADAQRLMNDGDLLGARTLLNPAIASAALPTAEERQAMQLQEQLNKTLIFSPRRIPNDPCIDSYTVQAGDMLQKIAPKYATTAKFIQRINNVPDARRLRAGQTIKLVKGPFHAVVTKSTFTMDLYLGAPGGEGSLYICSFPVGLGQDDSTPTGKWQIEAGKKLTNPKYYDPHGGRVIEPDDPANPLGEYWLGLSGLEGQAIGKTSYGIHGTIEPDSIGKMASAGCIRMRNDDVAMVYDMLVEGKSTVVVKP